MIPSYGGATGIKPLLQAQAEAQFLVDRFEARAADPSLASVNSCWRSAALSTCCTSLATALASPATRWADGCSCRAATTCPAAAIRPDTLTSAYVGENSKLDTHPVVVLNACQVGRQDYQLTGIGGFADSFLKRGAGAFIGTLWSVVDETARTFTETFYQTLLGNKTAAERPWRLASERARPTTPPGWPTWSTPTPTPG